MKRYFTFRNLHIRGGAALALSIAAIAALALLIGLVSAGVGNAQAQQAADTPTPAPTAASVPPVTYQEAQFELELPERVPPLGNLDSTLSGLRGRFNGATPRRTPPPPKRRCIKAIRLRLPSIRKGT